MPIITVVGASGNIQVTVDGAQNSALYNQATDLSNQLSSVISTLDAQNLSAGDTTFSDSNKAGYGLLPLLVLTVLLVMLNIWALVLMLGVSRL